MSDIMKDLLKLDGVAAYNRQEPSSGDLERVGNAYHDALKEVAKLKAELEGALKTIEYYGNEDTWISKKLDKDGNLVEWSPKAPNDKSIFPYSIGTSNGNFHCLGSRARAYLAERKKK